ncbi:MAG TPA: diguanylate cyclase [Rhodocyclaceae bacterium]|nr:diguanylate cyclase [Rhodocyclaceae bacterium]
MQSTTRRSTYLLLALPAVLSGIVLFALDLPAWISTLCTSLAAFLAPVVMLILRNRDLGEMEQRHQEYMQGLIDVIPQPVYVKDADSRYLLVNRAFADDWGRAPDEMIGLTPFDIASSRADATRSRTEDLAVLGGQRIRKEEHDTHPLNSGERHRLIMKGPGLDSRGQPIIVGTNFDITRWWIMEREMAETLERERTQHQDTLAFVQRIVDMIPFPVYVKDATSCYLLVNRAMAQDRGVPPEVLIGDMGLSPEATAEALREHFEEDGAVLAGEVLLKEVHGQREDGEGDFFRLVSKGACLDAQGQQVIVGTHIDLTDLRSAEDRLRLALEREVALRERTQSFIQRLIDVFPDPVYVKNSESCYLMVNEAFARERKRSKHELVTLSSNDLAPTIAISDIARQEDLAVLAGEDIEKEQHTVMPGTGEECFRIVSKRRCVDADGNDVVVGAHFYITRWKIAERDLQAALQREVEQRVRTERFVQDLIDVMPDPVYIKDAESRYLMVNDAFARYCRRAKYDLVGASTMEVSIGTSEAAVAMLEDREVIAGNALLKEDQSPHPITGEECFRIVCKRRCIHVDGKTVVVGINHHITEWRVAERELKRLAEEDVLTGIANRRHFTREAERAISQAQRYGEVLSLLILDIDHFKMINDQYGHNVGDEVLIELVRRVLMGLRDSDLPGRWGGEEFIVLLPHTTREAAIQVAERLLSLVSSTPFDTAAGPVTVSFSGGCAQIRAGETLEQLVGRADTALYEAKNKGRNRVIRDEYADVI